MKTDLKTRIALLSLAASLSLGLGSAAAQETPAPVELPSASLTAENFSQMERLARYQFEGEYLYFSSRSLKQEKDWLLIGDMGDDSMTVWLIDRTAEDYPRYRIHIPRYLTNLLNPDTEVVDHIFYIQTEDRVLQSYDVNTGELVNEIQAEVEFTSFSVWDEGNAIVGFMDNREVLVWDRTSAELISRWPVSRNLGRGTVLPSGYALIPYRGANLSAMDLRTGVIVQSWTDNTFDNRSSVLTPGQFDFTTYQDELLIIDNTTLQTVDRISLPVETLGGNRIPGTPFMLGWSEHLESYIQSYGISPAVYETIEGRVDPNQQGDLLLVLTDPGFDYQIYQLTNSGLQWVSFPRQIPRGDDDKLHFLGGDQLVSVQGPNRQQMTVTLWGIPE